MRAYDVFDSGNVGFIVVVSRHQKSVFGAVLSDGRRDQVKVVLLVIDAVVPQKEVVVFQLGAGFTKLDVCFVVLVLFVKELVGREVINLIVFFIVLFDIDGFRRDLDVLVQFLVEDVSRYLWLGIFHSGMFLIFG